MHQRKLFGGAAGEENKKMCVDGATQATTTVYIKMLYFMCVKGVIYRTGLSSTG